MRRCEVAFEQRRSIADVVREAIGLYIAKRPAKRGNQRLVRAGDRPVTAFPASWGAAVERRAALRAPLPGVGTVHHVTVLRASVRLTPLMIR